MSVLRRLVLRLCWSVMAAWIALSGVFFAFAYSPDDLQWKRGGRDVYREARNYDVPVTERYFAWVERYSRLDLGTTIQGEPVEAVLATHLERTLAYVVPATVVAVVLAVALGYVLASRRGAALDTAGTVLVYAWYGVPAFVLAASIYWAGVEYAGWYTSRYNPGYGLYSERNLPALVLPAVIVTGNMLAVWLRYARLAFLELLDAEFVKTLRANGAGSGAVFRHLLRNAAPTLVTVFFVEIVSVAVITTVVVETVLEFPGYGLMVYQAVFGQDIGLLMGAMLVPLGLAVFGNLLQDILYPVLDPRVEFGGA